MSDEQIREIIDCCGTMTEENLQIFIEFAKRLNSRKTDQLKQNQHLDGEELPD